MYKMAAAHFYILLIFYLTEFVLCKECVYTVYHYDGNVKTSSGETGIYCQPGYDCCPQTQSKCCKVASQSDNDDNYNDTSGEVRMKFMEVLMILIGSVLGLVMFITVMVFIRRVCCKDPYKKPKQRPRTIREVKGRRAVYIYKARHPKDKETIQDMKEQMKKKGRKNKPEGNVNPSFTKDDEDEFDESIRSSASSPAYSHMKSKAGSYKAYLHADGRVVYIASSQENIAEDEDEDGYLVINDETTDYPKAKRASSTVHFVAPATAADLKNSDDDTVFYINHCSTGSGCSNLPLSDGSQSSLETSTPSKNPYGSTSSLKSGQKSKHLAVLDSTENVNGSSVSLQPERRKCSVPENVFGSLPSLQNRTRRISGTSETGITFTTKRTMSSVSLSSQCSQSLDYTRSGGNNLPDTEVLHSLPILESVGYGLETIKGVERRTSTIPDDTIEELPEDDTENQNNPSKSSDTDKGSGVTRSQSDMSIFLAKSPRKNDTESSENQPKPKKKKTLLSKLVQSKSVPSFLYKGKSETKPNGIHRSSSTSTDDEDAVSDTELKLSAMHSQPSLETSSENVQSDRNRKRKKSPRHPDVRLAPTINEEDDATSPTDESQHIPAADSTADIPDNNESVTEGTVRLTDQDCDSQVPASQC